MEGFKARTPCFPKVNGVVLTLVKELLCSQVRSPLPAWCAGSCLEGRKRIPKATADELSKPFEKTSRLRGGSSINTPGWRRHREKEGGGDAEAQPPPVPL